MKDPMQLYLYSQESTRTVKLKIIKIVQRRSLRLAITSNEVDQSWVRK